MFSGYATAIISILFQNIERWIKTQFCCSNILNESANNANLLDLKQTKGEQFQNSIHLSSEED